MTQRSGTRSRRASETPILRRIRASITGKDGVELRRPAVRTARPAMAQRPSIGAVDDVHKDVRDCVWEIREDGTSTTLVDIPAVPANNTSGPKGVSLVFENDGNEWGFNPYDLKWKSAAGTAETTLTPAVADGGPRNSVMPVLPLQLAGAVPPFNTMHWSADSQSAENWWSQAHDVHSDRDWPDAPAVPAVEAPPEMASEPPRTAYTDWKNHLLDPDAAGQRADTRSLRLHARWNNLGAMNEARILTGKRNGENDEAVKAELVEAILTRAKAIEDDPAELVVAMAEAAL